MGLQKRLLEEWEERGYGPSDLHVCQFCFGDEYLKKEILRDGTLGWCSFCKDRNGKPAKRKVLPLEKLMEPIMEAIRTYYFPAEDTVPWDSEEKEYLCKVTDTYDVVHELNNYMQCATDAQLRAIVDIIHPEVLVEASKIITTPEEKDLELWKRFCELVKERKDLAAEQIVSLCARDDAPDDLQEMHDCLERVLYHAKEMGANILIHTGVTFLRCVEIDELPRGYEKIPATRVGTAPAKRVSNNRMSEQGDMMFYGASDIKTALREVFGDGSTKQCAVGAFHGNKQVFVLNLSEISSWRCPSIFDVENREKRSSWLFLKEFMEYISCPATEEDYAPTQVLTKYIQRKTKLKGIAYRSSKAPADEKTSGFSNRCYVLFVTNRNCLDECDEVDKKSYQLIMDPAVVRLGADEAAEKIK